MTQRYPRTFEIQISLPPDDALRLVRASLPTYWEYFFRGAGKHSSVYGTVRADGFAAEYNSGSRAPEPTLDAKVAANSQGSTVSCSIDANKLVRVFPYLFLFYGIGMATVPPLMMPPISESPAALIIGGGGLGMGLLGSLMGLVFRELARGRVSLLENWARGVFADVTIPEDSARI